MDAGWRWGRTPPHCIRLPLAPARAGTCLEPSAGEGANEEHRLGVLADVNKAWSERSGRGQGGTRAIQTGSDALQAGGELDSVRQQRAFGACTCLLLGGSGCTWEVAGACRLGLQWLPVQNLRPARQHRAAPLTSIPHVVGKKETAECEPATHLRSPACAPPQNWKRSRCQPSRPAGMGRRARARVCDHTDRKHIHIKGVHQSEPQRTHHRQFMWPGLVAACDMAWE